MDKKLLIAIVVIIGVVLLFSVMKGDKGKDIVVEDNAGQVVVNDEPVIVEDDTEDVSMEEEEPFIEPEISEEHQSEVNVERIPFNKDAEKDVDKQEVFEDDFYYVVRPGDTLWSLSLEYYLDPYNYKKIASFNGIDSPDVIYPGQKINFPGQIVKRDYIYTVNLGDNLWQISKKVYNNPLMWKFLAGYNSIDLESRIIWPGMKLRIPYNTSKYIAQEGDDMFKIAVKLYNSPLFAARLAGYNNIDYLYYVAPDTVIYYPEFEIR